ncbi:YbdD/YjiX family protein [Bacillus smithii]|uniref:YbdD/YjiX family protein n=1 Tax=Bacillus smithii TaxID=1479 RepID=UPI0030C93E8F
MEKVRTWMKKTRCNIKTIFGLPNYELYLEHHQKAHPDKPIMSEKEYYLFALKERYESGKVNRCC